MKELIVGVSIVEAITYRNKKIAGHFASSIDDQIYVIPKCSELGDERAHIIEYITNVMASKVDLNSYKLTIVVKKAYYASAYLGSHSNLTIRQPLDDTERNMRKETAARLRSYIDSRGTYEIFNAFVSSAKTKDGSVWVNLWLSNDGKVTFDYDYLDGNSSLVEAETMASIELFSQYLPKARNVHLYARTHGVNKLHADAAFQRIEKLVDAEYLKEVRTLFILRFVRYHYINKLLRCKWLRYEEDLDILELAQKTEAFAAIVRDGIDRQLTDDQLNTNIYNYLKSTFPRKQIMEAEDSKILQDALTNKKPS